MKAVAAAKPGIKIGIAGGGLIGGILALRAARAGANVEIFDSGVKTRCAPVAAGLLCPVSELSDSSTKVFDLGKASLPLWRDLTSELGCAETLSARGSLLLSHSRDKSELERVIAMIKSKLPDPDAEIRKLNRSELAELEADLSYISEAYLFENEAAVDVDRFLSHLQEKTNAACEAWHDSTRIDEVKPGKLFSAGKEYEFDWACDCRGLGAKPQLNLRPVRGEIIHLHAPAVDISRPVRLINRHHPIYITPRGGQRYLIGGTSIESGSRAEVTVRSALELLNTACMVHPGFEEASIIDSRVGLRPALPSNDPELRSEPGYISINGLYRHGYLVGPALAEQACSVMKIAA